MTSLWPLEPSYELVDFTPEPLPEQEYWYRVEKGWSSHTLWLHSYPVHRKTKSGVWLGLAAGEEKWISLSWLKQWACPTKEAALVSFTRRKEREIAIHQKRVEQAKALLKAAQQIKKEKDEMK